MSLIDWWCAFVTGEETAKQAAKEEKYRKQREKREYKEMVEFLKKNNKGFYG